MMRSFALNLTLVAILNDIDVSEKYLQASNLQTHPRITWLLGMQQLDDEISQTQVDAMRYWKTRPRWNAAMLTKAAKISGEKGQLQDAIQFANLSLEISPTFNEVAPIMANILNEHERWEQSLPFWAIAEQDSPNNAEIQAQYGYALFKYGFPYEARQRLEYALFLQPDTYITNNNYLLFLREHGIHEEYKVQLLNAYKLFPEAMIYVRWLGELSIEEKRFEDAEMYFLVVLENRPLWKEVVFELEKIYLIINQPEKTVLLYQNMLQRNPQEPAYHIGLIHALKITGDEKSAREHLCKLQYGMPVIFSEITTKLDFIDSKCSNPTDS